jgi:monoterpene epsilon-lactone hydrolase
LRESADTILFLPGAARLRSIFNSKQSFTGATMVSRKSLIRALLRNVVKPQAEPSMSLRRQRLQIEAATLTIRAPRGITVEVTTLGGIACRKLSPRGADPTRHLLYLHGGAYITGSSRSHTALAGQIGNAAAATVWLLDYRLAPEHPFPAGRDDALAAYRALLDSGVAADCIAIAGDSAGGGLTLATTLAIRDAQWPMPAALALLSPWTDLTLSGASIQRKAAVEPMLNAEWLAWAAALYCGGDDDTPGTLRTDPGISPVFADLNGFPPLLVHVGSDEILLDDSTFLVQRARNAGVNAECRVFDELWHVFQAQAGMIAEADESVKEIGAFIRRFSAAH